MAEAPQDWVLGVIAVVWMLGNNYFPRAPQARRLIAPAMVARPATIRNKNQALIESSVA